MDFLTQQHIYHGDLAARNVLLTDSLCVKISDFGLSKRLYCNLNDPVAVKSIDNTHSLPLPIKWMALEVLLRQEFIPIKSDVWSFGVLLWEVFEFGREPYRPGMKNCFLKSYRDNIDLFIILILYMRCLNRHMLTTSRV